MDVKKIKAADELENLIADYTKYLFLKRMFDITFSLLVIVILLPTFIVTSILIKLDDPKGTVFFSQQRVGVNGNLFWIYKFRTMHMDAEARLKEIQHLNESEGNMFKIKEDPRITRVGKVLRAYSIDELPQLFNVLKGDMSLIGPRPSLVTEYENFSDYDKSRLAVRPGITGLWQVSGRSALSFSEMIELDLQYIRTLSFKIELMIFMRTFLVVLKKENAY